MKKTFFRLKHPFFCLIRVMVALTFFLNDFSFLLAQNSSPGKEGVLTPYPIGKEGVMLKRDEKISPLDRPLHLSGDLGEILEFSPLEGRPMVYVVEDVHGDNEVQERIEEIIEHFPTSDSHLPAIFLEGASGKMGMSFFKGYPDKEALELCRKKWVVEGKISGGESFLVGEGVEGYGVEDRKEYWENIERMGRLLEARESEETEWRVLDEIVQGLRKQIYSKELLKGVEMRERYERGELEIGKYINQVSNIKDQNDKSNINFNDLSRSSYAMKVLFVVAPFMGLPDESGDYKKNFHCKYLAIQRFIKLQAFEEKIDPKQAEDEYLSFLSELEKKLPKEEVKEILRNVLEYRLGRQTQEEHYALLSRYLDQVEVSRYQNLKLLFKETQMMKGIEWKTMEKELNELEEKMLDMLAKNETQKKLLAVEEKYRVLKKIVAMEAGKEEIRKSIFQEYWTDIVKGIKELDGSIKLEIPKESLEKARAFYEQVLKRDAIIPEKLIQKIEEKNIRQAVLIVGGFHAQAVKECLKREKMGYCLIAPKAAQKDSRNAYFKDVKEIYQARQFLALPTLDMKIAERDWMGTGKILGELGENLISETRKSHPITKEYFEKWIADIEERASDTGEAKFLVGVVAGLREKHLSKGEEGIKADIPTDAEIIHLLNKGGVTAKLTLMYLRQVLTQSEYQAILKRVGMEEKPLVVATAEEGDDGGYIAKGEESKKEFEENRRLGLYKKARNKELEEEFRDLIRGEDGRIPKVYVIPALVKGREDYLLGYRDMKKNIIYVTEEVLGVLRRGPPSVIREYFWHEAHESSNPAYHYELIVQQQREFPENYEGRGYEKVQSSRTWGGGNEFWMDLNSWKIAKGILGEKLRFVIDGMIKARGPFKSMEEALGAYREIYGEPPPKVWKKIRQGKNLEYYEKWMIKFGIKDMMDLVRLESLMLYNSGRSCLSFLEEAYRENFTSYWPYFLKFTKQSKVLISAWDALVKMKPMIVDLEVLKSVWDDVMGLLENTDVDRRRFFQLLYDSAKFFGEDFGKYWSGALKLAKAGRKYSWQIYSEDSLVFMKKLLGDDFDEYWPIFVEIGSEAGEGVVRLANALKIAKEKGWIQGQDSFREILSQFARLGREAGEAGPWVLGDVLSAVKENFQDIPSLRKVGNDLVELVRVVGDQYEYFFEKGFYTGIEDVWTGDFEQMMEVLRKLYGRVEKTSQPQVLAQFTEIMKWSGTNPGHEERIRERLENIANESHPDAIVGDLEALLERLKNPDEAGEEDVYEFVRTQSTPHDPSVTITHDGMIGQGNVSTELFEMNLAGGLYEDKLDKTLTAEFQEVIGTDFQIYVIPAIVKGPDDFVLGARVGNRIYAAQEVMDELRRGPPTLLREYFDHETHCDPQDKGSHDRSIARQQKDYPGHYQNPHYQSNSNGVLVDSSQGFKIAKGLLGERLRQVIDGLWASSQPLKGLSQKASETTLEYLARIPNLKLKPKELEELKNSILKKSSSGSISLIWDPKELTKIESAFIVRHSEVPENDSRLLLDILKLEIIKEVTAPFIRVVEGKAFYLKFKERDGLVMLKNSLRRESMKLSSQDAELLDFLGVLSRLTAVFQPVEWAQWRYLIANFVIRENPKVLDLLEALNLSQREMRARGIYGTLKIWNQDVQVKQGLCHPLTVIQEMSGFLPREKLEGAFNAFSQKILTHHFEKTQGDVENFRSLFVTFICAGGNETDQILGRLNELKGQFDHATDKELLQALADIARGIDHTRMARGLPRSIDMPENERLNGFVNFLLNNYGPLIHRDILRFQTLGVILANVGIDGFEKIPFEAIRSHYKVEEGSAQEVDLLRIVAEISSLAREGTGELLQEVLELYREMMGDELKDFNQLLTLLKTFIRMVNFHHDFETLVNEGRIGKRNNETYYVSLRDLSKVKEMVQAEFEAGVPLRVAARRAIQRRYYNRFLREDRSLIEKLMRRHGLLDVDEKLDYDYVFEGLEPESRNIKVYEQKKGRMVQRKGEVEEVRTGEKVPLLNIQLEKNFEGLRRDEVLNASTRRGLAQLLSALGGPAKKFFNPVFLFGITSGGKSTLARIAAKMLGVGYTRIQITAQTDEFELFGSFQPYEINISPQDAYERIQDGLARGEFIKLEEALSRLEFGEEGKLFQKLLEGHEDWAEKYHGLQGEARLKYQREILEIYLKTKVGDYLRRTAAILYKTQEGHVVSAEELAFVEVFKSLAMLMDQKMGLRFVDGRFLTAYRKGDLILLDEANLANEEMVGVLYQMLTRGYLEYQGRLIELAPGATPRVVATGNPSTDSGRNRMSEAFMNRFEIIQVEDMNPDEMADLIVDQLAVDGVNLEQDLGMTREQLIQFAEIQRSLNNLLRTGKFSNMGQEENYVFTLRNLLRIVGDVRERKAAGHPVNIETWIQEAYLEYQGILVRRDCYTPDPSGNSDYRSLRNVFSVALGYKREGKTPEETLDTLIQERFGKIEGADDAVQHRMELDGLSLEAGHSEEEVLVDELIEVESTKFIETYIAKGIRQRQAVLFVGQSGGGKTDVIANVARKTNRKYVSVSLGDATLESLIGTVEYDRREKRFKYRPGILVMAMEEGSILALEELNMAKSGILEILNEYFDEGTFTNPFTLEKVKVHPDFRLFATMNPMEGTRGANEGRTLLSPALRSRFREVWVPHEKTDDEIRTILKGKFEQLLPVEKSSTSEVTRLPENPIIPLPRWEGLGEGELKSTPSLTLPTRGRELLGQPVPGGDEDPLIENMLSFYRRYQGDFEEIRDESYYTSLRDLSRMVRVMVLHVKEHGMTLEEALPKAIHRIYGLRMTTPQAKEKYQKILSDLNIPQYQPGQIIFERDENFLHVYEVSTKSLNSPNPLNGVTPQAPLNLRGGIDERGEDDKTLIAQLRIDDLQSQTASQVRSELISQGVGEDELDSRASEALDTLLSSSQLVQDPKTVAELSHLLEAFDVGEERHAKGRFNPVLFMGGTSGGKSSKVRYAALNLLGQGYTRIQFNERTDEIDLLGGYEPREVKMDFDEAYLVLTEAMKNGEWIKIKKALQVWKKGSLSSADDKAFEEEEARLGIVQANQEAMVFVQKLLQDAFKEGSNMDPELREQAHHKIINMAFLIKNGVLNVELEFKEGRFLKALRRGDVVLLDEMNLASEEIVAILYQFLLTGYLEYYDRGQGKIAKIFPGKGFKLAATANPDTYSGRNRLSEALMNRFEIHYIEDMAPSEMAEIVNRENGFEGERQTAVEKLSQFQSLLNQKMREGEFSGISSDPQGGYIFTLRNLKRIVKDERMLEEMGETSSFRELILREAFLEYSSVLGRSPENLAKLQALFKDSTEGFGIDVELPNFEFSKNADGVLSIGSIKLEEVRDEPVEEDLVEPLAAGPQTNRIRYQIAKGFLDRRRPMLVVGQSGVGKSDVIGDMARELKWKYRSVSLGNTSLEALVGTYTIDRNTKKLVYVPGILIQAMREGSILALEEINMASPALIEILNEFFDEETFTNPMTGEKESIHPRFRLFATMNPEQGLTGLNGGRNALSPSLRSRFNEVWFPENRSPEEMKAIIRQKMINRGVLEKMDFAVDEIYHVYDEYFKAVLSQKIGEDSNEGYFISPRDIAKIIDVLAVDLKNGIEPAKALQHAFERVLIYRLHSEKDRVYVQSQILKQTKKDPYTWEESETGSVVKCEGVTLGTISPEMLGDFILTDQSKTAVARILDALRTVPENAKRRFNPLMLIGDTSVGKSTMAELATRISAKPLTRIQMNQRTDESDLFGSFHPVEVTLDNTQAYEVVTEALQKKQILRIRQALEYLKISKKRITGSLGLEGDVNLDDSVLERYVQEILLKGFKEGDARSSQIFRDLAILLANGGTGIDLEFKKGLFLQAMRRGEAVLLDELNLASEDALALLYQLLTLGYIEFQGERIYPAEGFQLIVSLNPSLGYTGRNPLSEAFMDRFEIHHVREMKPEEMAFIIHQKYKLESHGISYDDVLKLAQMQTQIDHLSREGGFDFFNTDRSYRFALRNLERIAEDFIARVSLKLSENQTIPLPRGEGLGEGEVKSTPSLTLPARGRELFGKPDGGVREIFLEEAFTEYGTLLDQTDRNIRKLVGRNISKDLFQGLEAAVIPSLWAFLIKGKHIDPNGRLLEFESLNKEGDIIISPKPGEETRVPKRVIYHLLKNSLGLFNQYFNWEGMGQYAEKFEHTQEILRLNGVEVLKKPSDTETLANLIEPQTQLRSTALTRTQVLKGFRDGKVVEIGDAQGQVKHAHRSRPVLIVGQSGGGKSDMVGDIARELHWKYTSVSLGAATVDSLIGSYELDEVTGVLRFREGVLIKAMREGYCIVLEEINMADAAVIEILNEYFDRGTFTLQERRVQVDIHLDFRLFASMNPIQGKMAQNSGRVGLSPALRSRFREVWLRSERTRGEEYRIMLGGIKKFVGQLLKAGTQDIGEVQESLGEVIENLREGVGTQGTHQMMRNNSGVLSSSTSAQAAVSVSTMKMATPVAGGGSGASGGVTQTEDLEGKKKTYVETFVVVSEGNVHLAESTPDERGQTHWAYAPATNTLYYPPDELATTPIDEMVGVGIHESMHRYGTRYLSIFEEFLEENKLAGMIFNILEDGRIENWARLRLTGTASYLRKLNDNKIFNKPIAEMFAWEVEIREGPLAGQKIKRSYSSMVQDFFLYLAKRGSDSDAKEKIAEILDIMGQESQELRQDLETLMNKGVFGGAKDEDMLQKKMRGVFSLVPIKTDGQGRILFDRDPTEEYKDELAEEQGVIIREEMMPIVYKWAVQDVQEGRGKGEGQGQPGKEGEGDGTPGTGKVKPGKPGGGGKPISPKDWKKIWESLNPEDKRALEKALKEGLGDKAADRTKSNSKDFQEAQKDATLSAPISERDRLLKQVGNRIHELTGYLREIILNATRPKWKQPERRGRFIARLLLNAIPRGAVGKMLFFAKREIPTKKNVTFTLVIDASESMDDMQRMDSAVGYNALKGAFIMMETLENLGIDFNVRWIGDTTGLYKRFKNQPNPEGENIPNSFSTRMDREKIIQSMYESIGQKGGTNDALAIQETIKDIERYGAENHYVTVFTDGMGTIPQVQEILQKVRENKGRIGRSKTEFIGVGLGNATKIVPDVYGKEYSIHLKDHELRELPVRIKRLMERLINRIYREDTTRKAPSPLSGTSMSGASVDGMIGQGNAIVEFLEELNSSRFKSSKDQRLEQEFADVLDGHEVYVFDALIKGPHDFVLGYRDKVNKRLYVSREVLHRLEGRPNVLREYLFHEAHCDPDVEGSHYQTIAEQQRLYPENYIGMGYFRNEEGVLLYYARNPYLNEMLGFLWEMIHPLEKWFPFLARLSPKIAKGVLGKVLRSVIEEELKNEAPRKYPYKYRSFSQAKSSYEKEHGKIPEICLNRMEMLPSYRKRIKQFGFEDMLLLLPNSPARMPELLRLLECLEKVFGEDVPLFWPDFMRLVSGSRDREGLDWNPGLLEGLLDSFDVRLPSYYSRQERKRWFQEAVDLNLRAGAYAFDFWERAMRFNVLGLALDQRQLQEVGNIVLSANEKLGSMRDKDFFSIVGSWGEAFKSIDQLREAVQKIVAVMSPSYIHDSEAADIASISRESSGFAVVWKLWSRVQESEREVLISMVTKIWRLNIQTPSTKARILEHFQSIADESGPDAIVGDLEALLERLKKPVGDDEGDVYELATPLTVLTQGGYLPSTSFSQGGYIAQGTEAKAEFLENLAAGRYEFCRRKDFEEGFKKILEGYEVYVVPAIIKGPDDFFLGTKDFTQRRIYVTAEVLGILCQWYRDPKDCRRLISEYFWHEVHEEPSPERHESLIQEQQVKFKQNYTGKGYKKGSGYLIDPQKQGKVAKGELGDALCHLITKTLQGGQTPKDFVKDAFKAYRAIYGKEVDLDQWDNVEGALIPNLDLWVEIFGVKRLLEYNALFNKGFLSEDYFEMLTGLSFSYASGDPFKMLECMEMFADGDDNLRSTVYFFDESLESVVSLIPNGPSFKALIFKLIELSDAIFRSPWHSTGQNRRAYWEFFLEMMNVLKKRNVLQDDGMLMEFLDAVIAVIHQEEGAGLLAFDFFGEGVCERESENFLRDGRQFTEFFQPWSAALSQLPRGVEGDDESERVTGAVWNLGPGPLLERGPVALGRLCSATGKLGDEKYERFHAFSTIEGLWRDGMDEYLGEVVEYFELLKDELEGDVGVQCAMLFQKLSHSAARFGKGREVFESLARLRERESRQSCVDFVIDLVQSRETFGHRIALYLPGLARLWQSEGFALFQEEEAEKERGHYFDAVVWPVIQKMGSKRLLQYYWEDLVEASCASFPRTGFSESSEALIDLNGILGRELDEHWPIFMKMARAGNASIEEFIVAMADGFELWRKRKKDLLEVLKKLYSRRGSQQAAVIDPVIEIVSWAKGHPSDANHVLNHLKDIADESGPDAIVGDLEVFLARFQNPGEEDDADPYAFAGLSSGSMGPLLLSPLGTLSSGIAAPTGTLEGALTLWIHSEFKGDAELRAYIGRGSAAQVLEALGSALEIYFGRLSIHLDRQNEILGRLASLVAQAHQGGKESDPLAQLIEEFLGMKAAERGRLESQISSRFSETGSVTWSLEQDSWTFREGDENLSWTDQDTEFVNQLNESNTDLRELHFVGREGFRNALGQLAIRRRVIETDVSLIQGVEATLSEDKSLQYIIIDIDLLVDQDGLELRQILQKIPEGVRVIILGSENSSDQRKILQTRWGIETNSKLQVIQVPHQENRGLAALQLMSGAVQPSQIRFLGWTENQKEYGIEALSQRGISVVLGNKSVTLAQMLCAADTPEKYRALMEKLEISKDEINLMMATIEEGHQVLSPPGMRRLLNSLDDLRQSEQERLRSM
ncbi:MAG: AAA family ATPase [Chlamydiae bacterium]|nr:AAA family ATPase [Chlamydiota bacterium]